MRTIARRKKYAPDWPDLKLEEELTKETEGLFVWIAMMTRFLLTTVALRILTRSFELCCLANELTSYPRR